MGVGRLLNRPVVLHHPGEPTGETDAWGNPVIGPETTVDTVAYLEQTVTEEVVVGQQTASADWLIVLPAGTGLGATSSVEVPDMPAMFEVVGLPRRMVRPQTNTESHVEARLRIHTGG